MQLEQPDPHDIVDPEIHARYADCSRGQYTQHYLVRDENGDEAGFLSLEFWPLDHPFVIYEVFVPRKLRRAGLGTKLLFAAEQLARDSGYERTLVIPKTMDDSFLQVDLERWYANNRYAPCEYDFGAICKQLSPTPTDE